MCYDRDVVRLTSTALAIPPSGLRRKVGSTGEASEYFRIGLISAHTVENFLGKQGIDWRARDCWLDLACGCGRTLNFLRFDLAAARLHGCDCDGSLIDWCRENIPFVHFERNRADPPLPFPDGSFDVVYSISFFTHLSEDAQIKWLIEMKRVLRQDGVLLLTLHGRQLAQRQSIDIPPRGFLHHAAGSTFNEQVTYQTEDYVRRQWGRGFHVLAYESLGLDNYQDLALLTPSGKSPVFQEEPVSPAVPPELIAVWKRRRDLHDDFDHRGIGKKDSKWRNLSLVDWAVLHGHTEMPELTGFSPEAQFCVRLGT